MINHKFIYLNDRFGFLTVACTVSQSDDSFPAPAIPFTGAYSSSAPLLEQMALLLSPVDPKQGGASFVRFVYSASSYRLVYPIPASSLLYTFVFLSFIIKLVSMIFCKEEVNMSAPLSDLLDRQVQHVHTRFCMPGHKGRLSAYDVTECAEMDNLAAPTGALRQAHQLAAQAWGAKRAHFSVNGSTAGILAMFCATLRDGDRVLISGDAHLSIASALVLCGAVPIVMDLPAHQPPCPLSVDTLRTALALHTDVKAVFVTSPNFYGRAADIPALAALCHARNIPLLVDGAHGAHFGFCSALPPQPVDADAWVLSAHKTLFAPNQSAVLCLGKKSLVDETHLFDALNRVQTTSPSWPMLAAIDQARAQLHQHGQSDYIALLKRIDTFVHACQKCGIPVVQHAPQGFQQDPTRLVLDMQPLGLTGFDAKEQLERQGVWIEMADARFLVLITTPVDTDEDFSRLFTALQTLTPSEQPVYFPPIPKTHPSVYSPRTAAYGTIKQCELSASAGCIAAQAICCYPPASVIVWPGMRISEEQVAYLRSMHTKGAELVGIVEQGGSLWVQIME